MLQVLGEFLMLLGFILIIDSKGQTLHFGVQAETKK